MFTIKVAWNYQKDDSWPDYNMFMCSQYAINFHSSAHISLFLEHGEVDQREICLIAGATAFVMNDMGKTVDIIRTDTVEKEGA